MIDIICKLQNISKEYKFNTNIPTLDSNLKNLLNTMEDNKYSLSNSYSMSKRDVTSSNLVRLICNLQNIPKLNQSYNTKNNVNSINYFIKKLVFQ